MTSSEYEWRWAESLADSCALRAKLDFLPPMRDDEPPFALDCGCPNDCECQPEWNEFLRWAMDIGRREGEAVGEFARIQGGRS